MKKILIIEDDRDLNETISQYLQSKNFIVYSAFDGVQGVQEAIGILPDIIVCDISMPNLDGYGVFNTLKHTSSTAFIPFIFLTAKADSKNIRAGMNLGADDYITKPFTNSDLLEAINVRLKKYESLNVLHEIKLLSIIDNPINGIFIVQDKKIIFSNRKMSSLLSFEQEKFIEFQIEDFINKFVSQGDRLKVMTYFQQAAKPGSTADFIKFAGLTGSGLSVTLGLFVKPIILNDKQSILGYILEITLNDSEDDELKLKQDTGDVISQREKEVLLLICHGLINKEIADKLGISKRTVDRHRDNLMKKTNSRNTAELMVNGIKMGLVEL